MKVYCYVWRGPGRVGGFPDYVDADRQIAETSRLRTRLRDAISSDGRSVHAHGHLYRLEVRDFDTDNHICDVEARP